MMTRAACRIEAAARSGQPWAIAPSPGRRAGYHASSALPARSSSRTHPLPAWLLQQHVSAAARLQRPFALARRAPARALATEQRAAGEDDEPALEARPDPGPKGREKGALYSRGAMGREGGWLWAYSGRKRPGTFRRVCSGCLPQKAVIADYPDEHGKLDQLCAACARATGTHTVQMPCRDCPEDDIKEANYPDEHGKLDQLCAACARATGSYTVQMPCRNCPEGDKKQANYPDEHGKPNQLCGACARLTGSYALQRPCRDCPEGDKTDAGYPDEDGKLDQLCGACARAAGSYTVQRPCRDCPEGDKTEGPRRNRWLVVDTIAGLSSGSLPRWEAGLSARRRVVLRLAPRREPQV